MTFSELCEIDVQRSWMPMDPLSLLRQPYPRIEPPDIPTESHSATSSSSHNGDGSSDRNISYYAKCLAGGAISSSVRWALTPMDFIKTAQQAGRYESFAGGLALVFREQGISGLYRGFTPTVLAYSNQSGFKYATYEYLKYTLENTYGSEHKSLIYMISAGCAEAFADVLMCPWEMLKVKVQTTKKGEFPSRFGPALTQMIRQRHELGFPFGSLKPLWSRQVVGTVANFVTFEHTVNAIYHHLLNTHNKNDYGASTQLAVTFVAGYVSGTVATVVSHPADSFLSLQARYPGKSLQEIIQMVGWRNLATQGLLPRVALTGTTIALQWFIYDSFKSMIGLGTTGGDD